MRQIRLPALLVFFNFFITLTIFPGLAANISSVRLHVLFSFFA